MKHYQYILTLARLRRAGTVAPGPALPLALVLLLCLASGTVRATGPTSQTCTGWGSATTGTAELNLPSTLTIPVDAVAGSTLATGSATLSPGALQCLDTNRQEIYTTTWNWGSLGSDSNTSTIVVAPGIGLKLSYTGVSGANLGGGASELPYAGGSAITFGFNWSALNWTLMRIGGAIGTGVYTGGVIGIGTLTLPGGDIRQLNIQQSSAVTLTAACTLAADRTTLLLPDTSTAALTRDDHSDSRDLTLSVTCPAGMTMSNGTTLTLSTAAVDATDSTLVGSTGTAKGVGIEVLDDKGNRVNASGGAVKQASFSQGSSTAAPGTSQLFNVRMARQTGATVTAGTVQGTFTLTLTVN